MNDTGAKQQIVEKIRNANNILVTVSQNPSVDELSSALGLTVMLNKMNKHATAVFSGQIPPAITFLDPNKTFESTVDSLRDFIIALDKEKADHLRYKVDGDVVKIFITPYRTTINEKDLDFSQGDYNVELVLALGVTAQDQLDKALEAHGRIFHDATVATISVGEDKSSLGGIDWNERNASSLSEMLVSLSDGLRDDKSLLDEQIATAFLTGIVAATDRFSNRLTSSKAMTISAQLMAAGANQQLIASKLEEANEIGDQKDSAVTTSSNNDGTTDLSEGKSTKLKKNQKPNDGAEKPDEPKKKKDGIGELTISHEKEGTLDEVGAQTRQEQEAAAAKKAEQDLAAQIGLTSQSETSSTGDEEDDLAKELAAVVPATANTPSVADLQKDIAAADAEIEQAADQAPASMEPLIPTLPEPELKESFEPSLGGTLNATTEDAAEEKHREESSDRNHTILSHESGSYMGASTPTYNAPLNATVDPNLQEQKPLADPMAEPDYAATAPSSTFASPALQPITLADIDSANRSPHEEARNDIDAAYAAQAQTPVDLTPASEATSPMVPTGLPPMPDFTTLPPLPPIPSQAPAQDGNSAAPVDQNTSANPFLPPTTITPPQSDAGPSDPGQFQIPGAN